MLKMSLTGTTNLVRDLKTELDKEIRLLATAAEFTAKDKTPYKTGNARKNWVTKNVNANGFTVENRVPYIERLEAGASRQAPKGIIGPTLTTIKGKYK